MMRMVNDINAKYLLAVQSKTTCATCHRGKAKPDEVTK